jgi:hypothetical protein
VNDIRIAPSACVVVMHVGGLTSCVASRETEDDEDEDDDDDDDDDYDDTDDEDYNGDGGNRCVPCCLAPLPACPSLFVCEWTPSFRARHIMSRLKTSCTLHVDDTKRCFHTIRSSLERGARGAASAVKPSHRPPPPPRQQEQKRPRAEHDDDEDEEEAKEERPAKRRHGDGCSSHVHSPLTSHLDFD